MKSSNTQLQWSLWTIATPEDRVYKTTLQLNPIIQIIHMRVKITCLLSLSVVLLSYLSVQLCPNIHRLLLGTLIKMSKPVSGDDHNCKSHVTINIKHYLYFILLAKVNCVMLFKIHNTPIKIGHVIVGVLSSVFLLDINWMDVCFAL